MHDLFIYLCINSCYQLKQEIEDHRGHVNTLVFEEDGGKMYSGDSAGNVIIFNVFVGEQEPRLGNFLFTVQCLEDKNPTWLCKIMLLISLNISNHSLKKTWVLILGNEVFSLFIFRKWTNDIAISVRYWNNGG